MNVGVLLQAARRGEGLAAFGASVTPRPDVIRANVSLQIARIREHFFAVLAIESSKLSVNHFVPK